MKVTKIFVISLPLMFMVGCSFGLAEFEPGMYLMPVSILLVFLVPLVWAIDYAVDVKLHPEKYAAKKAARKAREDELWQKRQEMKYAKSIVEVKLLGGGSVKQKRAGAGGFALGGLLFGLPGAIAGSFIPDGTERLQRFAVRYGDGRVEVKECHPNSWEYKELIKRVKWEDLK